MKNTISIFTLSLMMVFACSCNKKDAKPDKWDDTITSGVIPIACDEGFRPIIEEEIDVFESIYKEASILPIFTDEVNAIDLLLKDSVRLAITTRKLTDNEMAVMAQKKRVVTALPIATDAVALIVNKSNPDSLIGIPTLKKIFTGEITDWKQLNPQSDLGKIDVLFDNPNSSIIRYAIDSICGGQKLSSSLFAQRTNIDVVSMVAKHPNSLGIIGVNWVGNKADTTNMSFNDQIRVMQVSPYEKASLASSYYPYQYYIGMNDYPMIRNVYILLSDPRSGLSSGFTTFITGFRGQKIILRSGLVPATQPLRMVNIRTENSNN